MQTLTFVIQSEQEGVRLDRFLADAHPTLSRSRWQAIIDAGEVRLNDRPAKAGAVLRAGDRIDATVPPPVPAEPEAQAIDLDILFEDDDYIVVNKPAGMVVHPAAGHQEGTLVNALLHHCGHLSNVGGVQRPGIVHRIDKDTSGILVATKNDAAHRHIAEQFERHTVERMYVALAWGGFRTQRGSWRGTIERDPRNRLRMTGKTGSGRQAVTHFEVIAQTPHFAHLHCRLETGRTHQVRVHCSEAGHPLVGDPLYGKSRSVSPHMGTALQNAVRSFARQALHAAVLGFVDRKGNALRFETPVPDDMIGLWTLMQQEDAP